MTAPLEGLRVLDVSTFVAGPSAAMTLAQLGADVTRIDPPGGAPDTRRLPRSPSGDSLYWAGLNRGKRSVELDIFRAPGDAAFLRMLGAPGDQGGIVLTNAPARAPLTLETLQSARADAILVRITGMSDGRPAVDYTVNCQTGLPAMTGPVGHADPVNHVLPAWDLLTGMHAAFSVLAAERVRSRTGGGQEVTISLSDVAVASMAHLGFVADVAVNGHGRERDGNHLYGSFGCDLATSDGGRVMVVALTPRHWSALVAIAGIAPVVDALQDAEGVDLREEEHRYRYRRVIEALLAPWAASRTLEQAGRELDEAGVLWGPYRSVEELVTDPASPLHEGDLMVPVDHPGIGTYPVPRPVARYSGWQAPDPRPGPVLGADTAEALG